ncbi:MAG: hypothetical protein ABIR55_02000, partial [Burkholderiaceae bacterium]
LGMDGREWTGSTSDVQRDAFGIGRGAERIRPNDDGAERAMNLKTIQALSGETVKVSNQWAAECEKRATTVSSSTWTYDGAGTLSGATLVTPLATTLLAPTSVGTLTNTVVLANGETLIAERLVAA